MSTASDFYLARADECARDAQNTYLENVRERCLRSEAAWRGMAQRVAQSETLRANLAVAKAAQDGKTA